MFHGLPSEDPIDHLDEFDRLCDLTKINGVSEDAIKLRLFPMSLADKAHQWEKSLPHGTITTWDECKKAFLAKFFSTGRTAKLRGEISSFISETMRHLQRLGRDSKAQSTMKKANFVSKEEMVQGQEEEENQFAEVCYTKNGQGGYQNGYYGYKSHPTMSYSNTDVANPQDQVYPPQQ
ncbi:unnamed protein product [Microthlaspi erraticum]|uniref:Retrotransposon gag domain-containing protein n=1 Tax=Microthlaspi erraticum TaxID=1685480 RepID=A0A6D2JYP1_9BRAS|nr:unnamed protein product [Microthlaspi erraticum]